MQAVAVPLRMYTAPTEHDELPWAWVEEQLASAGTYWVSGAGADGAHPRPVWGVWDDGQLHLSVGTPSLRRALAPGTSATVHLDSGTDVVIVDGIVWGMTDDPLAIAGYDAKYDWQYAVADYGPLLVVDATTVYAWRTRGPAGRDGFAASGKWRIDLDA